MNERRHSDVRVFQTPQELERELAVAFTECATQAIKQRGRFVVALSGGSTPQAAYALLAQPPLRDAVNWKETLIFFGDERCVPRESAESNYGMAALTLLSKVPLPNDNIYRMRGEAPPDEAAREYAQTLVRTLGENPRFDLILLGMGVDGHTASLFPGEDPSKDKKKFVRAPWVAKLDTHRLTLTPAVINNARRIIIALAGLPKAPALYAVLEGPYDPIEHPVQIVSPADGTLSWFVDQAAAAELPR